MELCERLFLFSYSEKKIRFSARSFMYLWLIFPNVMQTLKNLTDVYLLKNSQH